jgi:hypothetical protein
LREKNDPRDEDEVREDKEGEEGRDFCFAQTKIEIDKSWVWGMSLGIST